MCFRSTRCLPSFLSVIVHPSWVSPLIYKYNWMACGLCSTIGLYRDVWIAAIASSRKSLATQTAAICVRFQGRRVRHEYVTMHITFLTRKSALIYRRQPHSRLQWRCRDMSLLADLLRPSSHYFDHRSHAQCN